MKTLSLPAALLMGTLALGPQAHAADEAPTTKPPEGGTPTEQTVIVQRDPTFNRETAQRLLQYRRSNPLPEAVVKAGAAAIAGRLESAAKHGQEAARYGQEAAEHGQEAARYGSALLQAKAHAGEKTLPAAATLLD